MSTKLSALTIPGMRIQQVANMRRIYVKYYNMRTNVKELLEE